MAPPPGRHTGSAAPVPSPVPDCRNLLPYHLPVFQHLVRPADGVLDVSDGTAQGLRQLLFRGWLQLCPAVPYGLHHTVRQVRLVFQSAIDEAFFFTFFL